MMEVDDVFRTSVALQYMSFTWPNDPKLCDLPLSFPFQLNNTFLPLENTYDISFHKQKRPVGSICKTDNPVNDQRLLLCSVA